MEQIHSGAAVEPRCESGRCGQEANDQMSALPGRGGEGCILLAFAVGDRVVYRRGKRCTR